MLADLPEKLHTFYMPQVSQLGMCERDNGFGSSAVLDAGLGEGYLWVSALGENCLLSVHDFTLNDDFLLHEFPTESYCLSIMSDNIVDTAYKVASKISYGGDLISIYQNGSETQFTLPGKTRCRATTLCFTPEYFDHLHAMTGIDPDLAKEFLFKADSRFFGREAARYLQQMKPLAFMDESDVVSYASKAFEVLSFTMKDHLRQSDAVGAAQDVRSVHGVTFPDSAESEARYSARSHSDVVAEAVDYMRNHLSERLTLSDIARKTYISKSSLSEAFKEVTGAGVIQHLSEMRMCRAEELLTVSDVSISEIARNLGYRHQSSFCDAFKRRFGLAPSEVRRRKASCFIDTERNSRIF